MNAAEAERKMVEQSEGVLARMARKLDRKAAMSFGPGRRRLVHDTDVSTNLDDDFDIVEEEYDSESSSSESSSHSAVLLSKEDLDIEGVEAVSTSSGSSSVDEDESHESTARERASHRSNESSDLQNEHNASDSSWMADPSGLVVGGMKMLQTSLNTLENSTTSDAARAESELKGMSIVGAGNLGEDGDSHRKARQHGAGEDAVKAVKSNME